MREKKATPILLECIQALAYDTNHAQCSVYRYILSSIYEEQGNLKLANEWLAKSAALGNPQSYLRIGCQKKDIYDHLEKENPNRAISFLESAKEYFELALNSGEFRGAFQLGGLYKMGILKNNPFLYELLQVESKQACYDQAKNYFFQALYLLKLQPEMNEKDEGYQRCLKELTEVEEIYSTQLIGSNKISSHVTVSPNKTPPSLSLKGLQKSGQNTFEEKSESESGLASSKKSAMLSSEESEKSRYSTKRVFISPGSGRSEKSPPSSPRLQAQNERTAKRVQKINQEFQEWLAQQNVQSEKGDKLLVFKSNASHDFYQNMWLGLKIYDCVKQDAVLYEDYHAVCKAKENLFETESVSKVSLPELLQQCQSVRRGYSKLLAQLAHCDPIFKLHLSQAIEKILVIEEKTLDKQVSFDQVLKQFQKFDEKLSQAKKITFSKQKVFQDIIFDITQYLKEGKPLLPEKYLINDVRKDGFFFHQASVRHALLARTTNYYRATQLILCYQQNEKKIDSQVGTLLDNLYKKCCEEIKAKKKIDFGQGIFSDFVRFLTHHTQIGNCGEALIQAEFMVNWLGKVPVILTLSQHEGNTIVQLDKPVEEQMEDQKKELVNTQAQWFKQLPPWQQNVWQDNHTRLFTEPSTLRAYPTLPFYMHHTLMIFGSQYQLEYVTTRARSSIVVPYQLYKKRFSDCLRLTEQNVAQYIFNELPRVISLQQEISLLIPEKKEVILMPILYQTLLSHTKFQKIPGSENQMIEVKYEVFNQFTESLLSVLGKKACGSLLIPVFINTNYAINQYDENKPAGRVLGKPIKNASEVSKVFACARNVFERIAQREEGGQTYVKELIAHLAELEKSFNQNIPLKRDKFFAVERNIRLPKEYKPLEKIAQYLAAALLHYADLILERNHKYNLLMAAVETSLISAMGGITLATCKSGKDRTGVLQMVIDALEIYYHRGFLLSELMRNDSAGETIKTSYSVIFSGLFCSGHQQLLASTNAAGCIGLKSVKGALPSQMYEFIKQTGGAELLQVNDICSNLNRPQENKKIEVNLTYKELPTFSTQAKPVEWIADVRRMENNAFNFFKIRGEQNRTPNKLEREVLKSPKSPKKT